MSNRREIKLASKRKWDENDFNVKRGEIVDAESRILLHNQVPRSCLQSVLRDSFVHHFSRYFHGTWIRSRCREHVGKMHYWRRRRVGFELLVVKLILNKSIFVIYYSPIRKTKQNDEN